MYYINLRMMRFRFRMNEFFQGYMLILDDYQYRSIQFPVSTFLNSHVDQLSYESTMIDRKAN